jgi:hypothetical protein
MRSTLLLIALAASSGPAFAQVPAARSPSAAPAPAITIPPELTSPATAERLGTMMQALGRAMLNLPIGEIEAAATGRAATPADRTRTLRDVGRAGDPNFERNLETQLAGSKVAMQAGIKAMATALPAMSRALTEAAREMEKATANLPSPSYPKR